MSCYCHLNLINLCRFRSFHSLIDKFIYVVLTLCQYLSIRCDKTIIQWFQSLIHRYVALRCLLAPFAYAACLRLRVRSVTFEFLRCQITQRRPFLSSSRVSFHLELRFLLMCTENYSHSRLQRLQIAILSHFMIVQFTMKKFHSLSMWLFVFNIRMCSFKILRFSCFLFQNCSLNSLDEHFFYCSFFLVLLFQWFYHITC